MTPAMTPRTRHAARITAQTLLLTLLAGASPTLRGDHHAPHPGTTTVRSPYVFEELPARLGKSIEANKMALVTEGADGKASITYRTPSAVFAPYANGDLDAMARELDPVFAKIVQEAVGN